MSKAKLGFPPRKRHHLQQVMKDGKPVENTYICLTCEKERQ